MAFDAVRDDDASALVGGPLDAVSALVFGRRLWVGGEFKEVGYRVSVGPNSGLHKAACSLLNNRYAWRGYGSVFGIPTGAHHTTFVTEVADTVVGTLTLAIDSEQGLSIDQSFPQYAARARGRPGARICELTRFAFDGSVRSKEVLAGLFHMVFIYGTMISDCSDLFIEVHPRHVGFYEHMLGFQLVGEAGVNVAVGAPSQLMGLGVDAIRRQILELAGTGGTVSTRSLYPYFLPAVQELQIRGALALHRRTDAPSMRTGMSGPDEPAGRSKRRGEIAGVGRGYGFSVSSPDQPLGDISAAA